jgi:phage shock protein PspC (stress-responsive transcriptional regulator)
MKKTTSINLAGRNFYIEEDAYEKLNTYLNSVILHFATYPDHEEIVADMENRMAEQITDKKPLGSVITLQDVENIITSMGQVKDFGDAEQTSSSETNEDRPFKSRKLFRNPDDTILGGVCSGLSAYFGIETVIVRLIFFISIFFGGFGIFMYLVLWLITPEAVTPAEKIQMSGKTVTLSSLEQMAKEKVAEVKKNGTAKKLLLIPGKIIGTVLLLIKNIFYKIFPLIARIIGFFILLGSIFGLFSLTFVFVNLLFNVNSPYINFPIHQLIAGWAYFTIVCAGFLSLFIPALFFLFVGQSLLMLKSQFSKVLGISMLLLWVTAGITAGTLGIRLAPEIQAKMEESPEFKVVQKNYDLKDFSKLNISDSQRVTLIQGNVFQITAKGRQADLERLEIQNNEGELSISTKRNQVICFLCVSKNPTIEIVMPKLESLTSNGASRISGKNFSNSNLEIKLNGASRASLENTNTEFLKIILNGASQATLSGTSTELQLGSDSASRFNGQNLLSIFGKIVAQGASRVHVNISKNLNVKAKNASKVYYIGTPQITQSLSGSSKLLQEEQGLLDNPDNYWGDENDILLEPPREPNPPTLPTSSPAITPN